jgi:hypothetical protein
MRGIMHDYLGIKFLGIAGTILRASTKAMEEQSGHMHATKKGVDDGTDLISGDRNTASVNTSVAKLIHIANCLSRAASECSLVRAHSIPRNSDINSGNLVPRKGLTKMQVPDCLQNNFVSDRVLKDRLRAERVFTNEPKASKVLEHTAFHSLFGLPAITLFLSKH